MGATQAPSPMKDIVLFLQNRATRAGAQTSLARLVVEDSIRAQTPVVLLGSEGWLQAWCQAQGIANLVVPFPRSRSLQARLWGNAAFARRIRARLRSNGWRLRSVVANDHQDGLLAQAIAHACGTPSIVILRTPGMSQRDFLKYACDRFSLVYAVGEELRQAASQMLKGRNVLPYREGLSDDEFLPPKARTHSFPSRVLVAGSEVTRKGWADWVSVLDRIEAEQPGFRLDCDFTGPAPDPLRNDLQLGKARRSRFNFLGRVDGFRELVRQYDLVVHPSRHESFGLAPIEVLAAGVPLLCSRTGAITQVQDDARFLFKPGDAGDLHDRLLALQEGWATIDPGLDMLQQRIRSQLGVRGMASEFADELSRLAS